MRIKFCKVKKSVITITYAVSDVLFETYLINTCWPSCKIYLQKHCTWLPITFYVESNDNSCHLYIPYTKYLRDPHEFQQREQSGIMYNYYTCFRLSVVIGKEIPIYNGYVSLGRNMRTIKETIDNINKCQQNNFIKVRSSNFGKVWNFCLPKI